MCTYGVKAPFLLVSDADDLACGVRIFLSFEAFDRQTRRVDSIRPAQLEISRARCLRASPPIAHLHPAPVRPGGTDGRMYHESCRLRLSRPRSAV
jgi:hypothetical protein